MRRLFRKDKQIMQGRWGTSSNFMRKVELSKHDHCGTCPTSMVSRPLPETDEDALDALDNSWCPNLSKHVIASPDKDVHKKT